MLGEMGVQLVLADEALRAARTLVRLDHVVLRHVNLEMLTTVELLRADVAEVLFAFVYLFGMDSQYKFIYFLKKKYIMIMQTF